MPKFWTLGVENQENEEVERIDNLPVLDMDMSRSEDEQGCVNNEEEQASCGKETSQYRGSTSTKRG